MSTLRNPFTKTKAKAGEGEIVLTRLPPDKQVLTTFEYQYPLKLISPDPHKVTVTTPLTPNEETEVPVTTVFLLTYGGGLLAYDSINLTITLQPFTRLALLTQGSTKIFKADSTQHSQPGTLPTTQQRPPTTSQTLNVKVSPHSTLCYLPDPNQPYAYSIYEQRQTFYVDPFGSSSLLFLDWVSEGRSARGEHWTLTSWKGRNEVREFDESSKGRLLLRDSLLLFGDDLAAKTDKKGIMGTLVIYGPVWKHLAEFFMQQFQALPRIGAKTWQQTSTVEEGKGQQSFSMSSTGKQEQKQDSEVKSLLWTAAKVRGFVLVKFAAADVDGARLWLGQMLKREGSVEREFSHRALLCLR
ncbi:hypothetical protein LTS08_006508 [Lithohypha guttulata]|nr:hypothetical protein LTS08_006508 [Lithohypha guttulata]